MHVWGRQDAVGVSNSSRAWLTVGIPTVPRKHGADYLTRTLETLLEEVCLQLQIPNNGQVTLRTGKQRE